jgi:hypothetical protein
VPAGNRGTRNFENWQCDQRGNGMGYGVILDTGGSGGLWEYQTNYSGFSLNGAVTIWIRRPLNYQADGTLADYSADNDNMVMVVEGTAPYTGAAASSAFGSANKAVAVIEVALAKTTGSKTGTCGQRGGQAGGGSLGANMNPCNPLDPTDPKAVGDAIGATMTGLGTELDANK